MKATGIVRRIDDLGRVVIPKEIRRTLRIREGDPLEIFTAREGEIILKRYSPIGELASFAGQICESLNQMIGGLVCVCDMDQVIAATGNGKKDIQGEYISTDLLAELDKRKILNKDFIRGGGLSLLANKNMEFISQIIAPIMCEGDVIGGVLLLSKEEKSRYGQLEEKMAGCAALFLGKQMEQ